MNSIHDSRKNKMMIFLRAMITGWFGGLFWTSIVFVLYYFNFIDISPASVFVRSWSNGQWSFLWQGELLAIFLASLVSIVVALVYYALFRKRKTIWFSIFFGFFLWGIFQFVIIPLFYHLPNFFEQSSDSIVSSICIFILYGMFIGFSISYDYKDTLLREKKKQS